MNDMRAVIVPKSDQTNADDLLTGPLTITVTRVEIRPGTEQPVSISFDGDNGKPYRPCKSMARVLVSCWGADANKYVGRSMTLYRDPNVRWGGLEVGGIRISHMSDLEAPKTLALTVTKGNKKPFVVRPLERQSEDVGELKARAYEAAARGVEVYKSFWETLSKPERSRLAIHHEDLKAKAVEADALINSDSAKELKDASTQQTDVA